MNRLKGQRNYINLANTSANFPLSNADVERPTSIRKHAYATEGARVIFSSCGQKRPYNTQERTKGARGSLGRSQKYHSGHSAHVHVDRWARS